MLVYIVNLRSTSELWHTFVAAHMDAVITALDGHGITSRIYGTNDSDFQEWLNPRDGSQSATISRVKLLGVD